MNEPDKVEIITTEFLSRLKDIKLSLLYGHTVSCGAMNGIIDRKSVV